jgi:hypothetical protein
MANHMLVNFPFWNFSLKLIHLHKLFPKIIPNGDFPLGLRLCCPKSPLTLFNGPTTSPHSYLERTFKSFPKPSTYFNTPMCKVVANYTKNWTQIGILLTQPMPTWGSSHGGLDIGFDWASPLLVSPKKACHYMSWMSVLDMVTWWMEFT